MPKFQGLPQGGQQTPQGGAAGGLGNKSPQQQQKVGGLFQLLQRAQQPRQGAGAPPQPQAGGGISGMVGRAVNKARQPNPTLSQPPAAQPPAKQPYMGSGPKVQPATTQPVKQRNQNYSTMLRGGRARGRYGR